MRTEAELIAEIAELQATAAAPSPQEVAAQQLASKQKELADLKRAEGSKAAEARLTNIYRAYTGLVSGPYVDDAARFEQAVHALIKVVETINARFRQLVDYQAECRALCHRFGLPMPDLEVLPPPMLDERFRTDQVPPLSDFVRITPVEEESPEGLRKRRSYAEVSGSPGFDIIMQAGLPDFPPLNPRQREILAEQERAEQSEQAAGRRFAVSGTLPPGTTAL